MLMFVVRKYKYSFSADKQKVPLQLRDADRVNILNDDLILYLKLCHVSDTRCARIGDQNIRRYSFYFISMVSIHGVGVK